MENPWPGIGQDFSINLVAAVVYGLAGAGILKAKQKWWNPVIYTFQTVGGDKWRLTRLGSDVTDVQIRRLTAGPPPPRLLMLPDELLGEHAAHKFDLKKGDHHDYAEVEPGFLYLLTWTDGLKKRRVSLASVEGSLNAVHAHDVGRFERADDASYLEAFKHPRSDDYDF